MRDNIKKILFIVFILALVFACGYWAGSGNVKKEYLSEEVVKTQTVVSHSIQYIKEKEEERSSEKSFDGERIITREIKVPCKCPPVNKNTCGNTLINPPASQDSLKLEFEHGYQILSERIEERGKSSEKESESFRERSEVNEHSASSKTVEDSKQVHETITPLSKDWFFELNAGYNWDKNDIVFGAAAYRRIIGPIHLGLEIKSNKQFQGDVSLGLGVSF